MRPGPAVASVAIVLALVACYAGWRLWVKSSDRLRPVVVMRGADAAALVTPSLGARLRALSASGAPEAERPKLIALTFDDGPYPVTTPLLLQTLHDLHVPATFFLIGRDAQQYPGLTRAIAAGGHEIADHTLSHPNLDTLSDAGVAAELRDGAAALGGIAPDAAEHRLFRPPHGRYTLATVRTAQAAGYDTILWNDDPGDWRSVGTAALAAHIFAHATAPEILLLHSGRTATIALLPELVTRYRQAGYAFVTVGRLLRQTSPAALNRPAAIAFPSS